MIYLVIVTIFSLLLLFSPTVIRIFKSKRKGTVAIRVNVNSRDYERVLQNDFWPENVYARPWVSQAKWQDKKKET